MDPSGLTGHWKTLEPAPNHKEQSFSASSAALWKLSLCLTVTCCLQAMLSQLMAQNVPSLCATHNLCTWAGLAGPIQCTQLKEHVLTALSKKSHPFRNGTSK